MSAESCCIKHVGPIMDANSCYLAAFHGCEPCCDDCPEYKISDPEDDEEAKP